MVVVLDTSAARSCVQTQMSVAMGVAAKTKNTRGQNTPYHQSVGCVRCCRRTESVAGKPSCKS